MSAVELTTLTRPWLLWYQMKPAVSVFASSPLPFLFLLLYCPSPCSTMCCSSYISISHRLRIKYIIQSALYFSISFRGYFLLKARQAYFRAAQYNIYFFCNMIQSSLRNNCHYYWKHSPKSWWCDIYWGLYQANVFLHQPLWFGNSKCFT